MNTLVIRPKKSHPGDGYGAFGPEGDRFVRERAGSAMLVEVDARKMLGTIALPTKNAENMKRRSQVLAAIDAFPGKLEWLAFFCHGWRTGIQPGFNREHAAQLALALRKKNPTDTITVTLYACSTAQGNNPSGDGGFADALRDALALAGFTRARVDAHATAGHATMNPFVVRFEGDGQPHALPGGTWLVSPTTKLTAETQVPSMLFKRWRYQLASTSLRFHFSEMSQAEVIVEVGSS